MIKKQTKIKLCQWPPDLFFMKAWRLPICESPDCMCLTWTSTQFSNFPTFSGQMFPLTSRRVSVRASSSKEFLSPSESFLMWSMRAVKEEISPRILGFWTYGVFGLQSRRKGYMWTSARGNTKHSNMGPWGMFEHASLLANFSSLSKFDNLSERQMNDPRFEVILIRFTKLSGKTRFCGQVWQTNNPNMYWQKCNFSCWTSVQCA